MFDENDKELITNLPHNSQSNFFSYRQKDLIINNWKDTVFIKGMLILFLFFSDSINQNY